MQEFERELRERLARAEEEMTKLEAGATVYQNRHQDLPTYLIIELQIKAATIVTLSEAIAAYKKLEPK